MSNNLKNYDFIWGEPVISVIMPVFNARKYIYSAVDSILKQSFSDFELILIDDCGTDGSIDLIKNSFNDNRIKYIVNPKNMGIAYSRNCGLKEAKGDFIAFMDDDDIAPLNRFSLEVQFLNSHPDIGAVGGRYCMIDENDIIIGYSEDTLQNPEFIKACLIFYDPLGNGTMLFRNSIIRDNNLRFKDDCYGMEDYLFWIDFSSIGNISNLKEIMLYWRNIKGNETNKWIDQRRELRKSKYAEIQKYAFCLHGFEFSVDEMNFITEMFQEGRFESLVTKSDLKRVYNIFISMINQSENKKMKNYKEIRAVCQKQFSRRLEYSEVWNI